MQNKPIEVGDVVRLKSGGPNMTVYAFEADGRVECIWDDRSGYRTLSFKPIVLMLAPVNLTDTPPDPGDGDDDEGPGVSFP